jgi:hypothetical protein
MELVRYIYKQMQGKNTDTANKNGCFFRPVEELGHHLHQWRNQDFHIGYSKLKKI